MLADGAIRCVQHKLGDPVDRLLHMYYEGIIDADMIATYASIMPLCKESIEMISDAVSIKYPFAARPGKTNEEKYDMLHDTVAKLKNTKNNKTKENE